MLAVESFSFDGIAGGSTYYRVGPDRKGQYREFSGLLQGGFLFPGLRARVYAIFHR